MGIIFDTTKDGLGTLMGDYQEMALRSLWGSGEGGVVSKDVWIHINKKFGGFNNAPEDAKLLLKLHGSLGWYVIQEGSGDIGYRDDLRDNLAYKYFRLPYDFFWNSEMKDIIAEPASLHHLSFRGHDGPVADALVHVQTYIHQSIFSSCSWYGLTHTLKGGEPSTCHLK